MKVRYLDCLTREQQRRLIVDNCKHCYGWGDWLADNQRDICTMVDLGPVLRRLMQLIGSNIIRARRGA